MKTKEERKEIQDGRDGVDVQVYTFSENTNALSSGLWKHQQHHDLHYAPETFRNSTLAQTNMQYFASTGLKIEQRTKAIYWINIIH